MRRRTQDEWEKLPFIVLQVCGVIGYFVGAIGIIGLLRDLGYSLWFAVPLGVVGGLPFGVPLGLIPGGILAWSVLGLIKFAYLRSGHSGEIGPGRTLLHSLWLWLKKPGVAVYFLCLIGLLLLAVRGGWDDLWPLPIVFSIVYGMFAWLITLINTRQRAEMTPISRKDYDALRLWLNTYPNASTEEVQAWLGEARGLDLERPLAAFWRDTALSGAYPRPSRRRFDDGALIIAAACIGPFIVAIGADELPRFFQAHGWDVERWLLNAVAAVVVLSPLGWPLFLNSGRRRLRHGGEVIILFAVAVVAAFAAVRSFVLRPGSEDAVMTGRDLGVLVFIGFLHFATAEAVSRWSAGQPLRLDWTVGKGEPEEDGCLGLGILWILVTLAIWGTTSWWFPISAVLGVVGTLALCALAVWLWRLSVWLMGAALQRYFGPHEP